MKVQLALGKKELDELGKRLGTVHPDVRVERSSKRSTTTHTGLQIQAKLDENAYTPGIKVSDQELAALAIERDEFHGEWNYRLMPRTGHT